MRKITLILILFFNLSYGQIPEQRIVAEWEPALGTMIRWPLGIGSGSANRDDSQEDIVIFIPDLNDVKRLKEQ